MDAGHRARAATRPASGSKAVAAGEPMFLSVMPAIETHELAKDYTVGFWRPRPYRALDGLTLAVEPGEVFGFLGPNGAGKTTTLKLLMQLVYPTSGTATILGRPLGDLEMKRRIGYLPENPYFYDYLTAEELLELLRRPVRLHGRRTGHSARGAAARRGRARRRAPPAAAQVLEGHDPARRAGPGADQRSRGGLPRRADVGPRPARPPRRARPDPAAARRGPHRLLQLAHPVGRRDALQPRSRSSRRAG